MSTQTTPQTWPDLAGSLYDFLTGRGAEISYEFDDMRVMVPTRAGTDVTATPWKLDGTLRITTRNGE